MAQTVKLRRSATPSAVPTTAQLSLGELAINTYDGKLFLKKNVSGVESIVDVTSGGTGVTVSTTAPVSPSSGALWFDSTNGVLKIYYTDANTSQWVDAATQSFTSLSGTVPLVNGGTGTSTAFTQGSIVFAGASGVYTQDNAKLFWDDTNNRLGIGTATPAYTLDVSGTMHVTGAATFDAAITGTNLTATGSLIVGSGGTYAAGSLYSDANWGMIFRAKQASPATAEFLWVNSAGSELFRYAGGVLTASTSGNAATATQATSATQVNSTAQLNGYAVSAATIAYNTAGGPMIGQAQGSGAAMLSFHRPSVYGVNLGLDTDNVLKIGGWSMGAVSYPILHSGIQPAFSAYQSAAQPTVSAATWTKIKLQTEEFDTANCFDNVTNFRFTPTVAGYYLISGAAGWSTSPVTGGSAIYKNGVLYKKAWNGCNINSGYPTYCVTSVVYMNGSTDYVELYGYTSTAGVLWSTIDYTYFNGCLVRAA